MEGVEEGELGRRGGGDIQGARRRDPGLPGG